MWRFTRFVEEDRAHRLLAVPNFDHVCRLLDDAVICSYGWKRKCRSPLLGCSRPEFILRVHEDTYDAFFNSPNGYRGQYAISAERGIYANRRILEDAESRLLAYACTKDASEKLVITSLRGWDARIWIDEPEVTEEQLWDGLPAIDFEKWAHHKSFGIMAPVGERLKVMGAWLDERGQEQRDPDKVSRAEQIHDRGFI